MADQIRKLPYHRCTTVEVIHPWKLCSRNIQFVLLDSLTLHLQTNIAPENRGLENEFPVGKAQPGTCHLFCREHTVAERIVKKRNKWSTKVIRWQHPTEKKGRIVFARVFSHCPGKKFL